MKFPGLIAMAFLMALFGSSAGAQTLAHSPAPASGSSDLQILLKKIDEQNGKIDTLSQQILKLEQQIANLRPGVMIGEPTPPPSAAPPATATTTAETSAHAAAGGNTHTVARGETLTSIAKMHGVTISELQKFNHIENDRKLQIGQTIMIPAASSNAPSVTVSPN